MTTPTNREPASTIDILRDDDPVLNVAAFCPETKVLGPGCRFAIWLQGCPRSCPGCIAPDFRHFRPELQFGARRLARYVNGLTGIEGITVSGGEPLAQPKPLRAFLEAVERDRLTVILYSGYTLEEVRTLDAGSRDGDFSACLSMCDVIIDGEYVESLNDDRGLRGSSNQVVHFQTGRYRDREEHFQCVRRDLEIHPRNGFGLIVGIKPRGVRIKD